MYYDVNRFNTALVHLSKLGYRQLSSVPRFNFIMKDLTSSSVYFILIYFSSIVKQAFFSLRKSESVPGTDQY